MMGSALAQPACDSNNTYVGGPRFQLNFVGLTSERTFSCTFPSSTTEIDLRSNLITSIPRGAFAGLSNLTILLIENSTLARVSADVSPFSGLVNLRRLTLGNNDLTNLPNATFGGLSNLVTLNVAKNRITSLSGNVFAGLSSLEVLFLSNNLFTELPSGIFSDLSNLEQLYMTQCLLASLPSRNLFSSLVQLRSAFLNGNRLTVLPAGDLFAANTNLNVLWLNANSLTEISAELLSGRVANVPEFRLNPNPLLCDRANATAAISCRRCALSYNFTAVGNSTGMCRNSIFAPRSGWNPDARFNAFTLRRPLYPGNTYTAAAINELMPISTNFYGYAHGNFAEVRYELDFAEATPVNLSCSTHGEETFVSGDTSDSRAYDWQNYANTQHRPRDLNYGNLRLYDSREHRYRFVITAPGNVTLSTCLTTNFSSSLAVYREETAPPPAQCVPGFTDVGHLSSKCVGVASRYTQVLPERNRSIEVSSYQDGRNISVSARFPHEGGCGILYAERRGATATIHLDVGAYIVVVEGGSLWKNRGSVDPRQGEGQYTLSMMCSHGAQTAKRDITGIPGNFSINSFNGAIVGIPASISNATNYTATINAVDSAGNRAALQQLQFEIAPHPTFSRRQNSSIYVISVSPLTEHDRLTPEGRMLDAPGNNLLTVNETYLITVEPRNSSLSDFVLGAIGELSYSLETDWTLNPSPLDDVLLSPSGTLRVSPTAVYNSTIVRVWAVDSGGVDRRLLLQEWNYSALVADVKSHSNGPRGMGCQNNGQPIDTVRYDNTFSCDCSGTPFIGTNCDIAMVASKAASDNDTELTALSAALAALFVICVCSLLYFRRSRHLAYLATLKPHDFQEELENLFESGAVNLASNPRGAPPELLRASLQDIKLLGKGQFGEVRKAQLSTQLTIGGGDRGSFAAQSASVKTVVDVAVKSLLDQESATAREEFLTEALMTWQFEHDNVVRMYGVVTSGPPFLLVLEFCTNGELKTYLEDNTNCEISQLYSFMRDIAAGMKYLAGRGYIHRDLAARNVLVTQFLDAKIADFGLGRNQEGKEYYLTNDDNLLLPLRWTDPAVLETYKFSESSDVWSYGVTAIEIFTNGRTPYHGWLNSYIVEQVKDGYRLPRPETCPEDIYDNIIFPCWKLNSADRPTFEVLHALLEDLADNYVTSSADTAPEMARGSYVSIDGDAVEAGSKSVPTPLANDYIPVAEGSPSGSDLYAQDGHVIQTNLSVASGSHGGGDAYIPLTQSSEAGLELYAQDGSMVKSNVDAGNYIPHDASRTSTSELYSWQGHENASQSTVEPTWVNSEDDSTVSLSKKLVAETEFSQDLKTGMVTETQFGFGF